MSDAWKTNPYFTKGTPEYDKAHFLNGNEVGENLRNAARKRMTELNKKLTREECQRRRAKSFRTHPELRQKLSELRKAEWASGAKKEYGKEHAKKYFQKYNEKRHLIKLKQIEAEKNIARYTHNNRIKPLPKQDESYYDEINEFFGDII